MAYEIPWAPLDITPGVRLLLDTMQRARQGDIAQQQADTQAAYAKNAESRESAMEARNKQTFEQGQAKARTDAIKSAIPLMSSMPSAAAMLLKPHGISATPELGQSVTQPPEVITPMSVLQRAQGPSVAPPAVGQHSGAPVADTRMAPVEAPQTIAPGDAVEDQMPLTVPGDVTPGAPTGAFSFKGSNGEDMGRFDPAEERAFRTQRATEAGASFEGIDPKYARIAEALVAGGTDPQKIGGIIAGAMEHEAQRKATAEGQDDKQAFAEMMKRMFGNEPITIADRDRWAQMAARARAASAGATPVNAALPDIIRMAEEGASESDVYAAAAKAKLTAKDVQQPVQNVIKNAASSERAGQKREALTATDEANNVIGTWKNPQAATKGTQQIQRFHRVKERLEALIKDVETTGERIGLDSKEYVRRMSLSEGVAAALRPYNELSSTDASMKAERAILGPTGAFGHGWALGADLQTLKHILHEAEGQQRVNLNTMLRPSGSPALAPSLGGPRKASGSGPRPHAEPVGATKFVNGRQFKKVGPDDWQPVAR